MNTSSSQSKFAQLKIPGSEQLLTIPVTHNKPEIPEDIQEKWQKMINLTAEIMGVSSGLVTHFTNNELQVFLASQKDTNPYHKGASDSLGIGMFCEYVVGKKQPLLVEDTEASVLWRNHPHTAFGMRSYLGVPLEWKDGELFGSLCVLDADPNPFSSSYMKLMEQFKSMIESDLSTILLINDLKEKVSYNEIRLRDIHHRLKNQFNLLTSYIGLKMMDDSERTLDDVLTDINLRIEAMSSVHEEICNSANLETPSLEIYLPALCQSQLKSFPNKDITLTCDVDTVELPLQETIGTGLIFAELITNSVKHAFKNQDSPAIHVRVQKKEDSTISFEYRDNGVGFPEGFEVDSNPSIGMSLLQAFTAQLRGEFVTKNDKGAVVEITFKLTE
ncbi:histidine kinase dimerization/phosphoacceptor domain -containing protein [Balneolaceae bacterium ANBcel3]|nr:histidine kinase dimerization/phosphoacceptor domain -containing protein [Balneolaceae bacterium ANBcel3]